jgi:purine-nucleoside phosphorylase
MTYEEIKNTADFLKNEGIENPEIGIVLGTGLGKLVNDIKIIKEIPYEKIPGFPVATVEFHSGKLIYGTMEGKKVLAMNGRFHYYEGYTMKQVSFPIRVMKLLGIKFLLLSNAAGAMNLDWKKGDLMLIRDHINFLPSNPLIGKNIDELGPRFPDMSKAYSPELNSRFEKAGLEENINLRKGVYIAVQGSMLESPAEYKFLRKLGADAVGMSTVPEVIVANHMSLPCAAISVLTDECDPENLKPVNISEIIEVAGRAEEKLVKLFRNVIRGI